MHSLYPLDHLYISWVQLSSFLYPLLIMTKRGRNCGDCVVFFIFYFYFYKFFYFKILHVRGRNTFFYKGEMCFILLGGELTSFFLYTGLLTMFTYIVLIFDIYIYIWWCMFSSPTFTCVVSFLSLYTCFLYLVCNLLFLFYIKMPW